MRNYMPAARAMQFLRNTFNYLKHATFWSRTAHGAHQKHKVNSASSSNNRKAMIKVEDDQCEASLAKCEQWLEGMEISRKRPRQSSPDTQSKPQKRPRVGYPCELVSSTTFAIDGSDWKAKHEEECSKWKSDRELMPPPATPVSYATPVMQYDKSIRTSLDASASCSENQTQITRYSETDNTYNMEEARRRAAATRLPPNTGIWEPAEKDLFFHIGYRGFEPLFPKTWMIDFPTLPLSLFATQEHDEPLIKPHISTDFRAIKALQDLIDIGKTVRDRALSSSGKLSVEPILGKAIQKYIRWALKDVGFSTRQYTPIHAVVAMRPGHRSQATIRRLAIKMHKLSRRHRELCNILTTVEQGGSNSPGAGETRLDDDQDDHDSRLPVIFGLMICSSVLAIFTLNSHTSPPTFVARALAKSKSLPYHSNLHSSPSVYNEDDLDDDGNEDSGLRFIEKFDFSDSSSDVWNTFVVAITAIMIRKSMVEKYPNKPNAMGTGTSMDESDFDSSSILDGSMMDIDEIDPDL